MDESGNVLVRQTKTTMAQHPESVMWRLCRGEAENADGKTAFDGMRRGDETADQDVHPEHGRYASVTEKAASLGNDAGLVGAALLSAETHYCI